MNWKKLTNEALQEWQSHPVTLVLKGALAEMLEFRRKALLEAYWAGNAPPEADRLSLSKLMEWQEDFFEASAEDVQAMMEAIDEHQRNNSD